MYKLFLELPGLPKPVNRLTGEHWAVRFKNARMWKQAVMAATYGRRPPVPLERARLTLTRISSCSPDPDGLVSSFKAIIDGLIAAKILENDRAKNIGMPIYKWIKGKPKQGKVIIEVEEIE